MVLTIKRFFGIYKRFSKDIWGLSFSNFSITNKVTFLFYKLFEKKREFRLKKKRRYIYRIDIIDPLKKKKYFKTKFLSLRLAKLFFLTLTYKQFRLMVKIAAAKDGLFESNYCILLEGRLVSMVYRTNFLYNMFEIISFVKASNILVNNVLINYVNFVMNVGDFLTFFGNIYYRFRSNFFKRFKTHTVVFNTPRYMLLAINFFLLLWKSIQQKKI